MLAIDTVHALTDEMLLSTLRRTMAREREQTVQMLLLLAEVDARRLYLRFACSSLFVFATRELKLSESSAYKRIQVARAARRHPQLLQCIASGRLHLSAAVLVVPHLKSADGMELLNAA